MAKYLSGRQKVKSFSGLSSDRHLYLELNQAEPNLGFPGEKLVAVASTYYRLVTIPGGTVYDRYWAQDVPAGVVTGFTVFDEGIVALPAGNAGINSINKLDFVGSVISASAHASGIATVTVFSPGYQGNILYNNNGDIDATNLVFVDTLNTRVGIASTIPTAGLDVNTSIKINGTLYDKNNQVGTAGLVLTSTGIGVSWGAVPNGIQGIQGIQGITGSQGATGPQGTQGIQGSIGPQGTQGIQGIIGSQGTQGLQGIAGSQGTQGLQGVAGSQGIQGSAGPQGTQGIQGSLGITGAQGIQGITGSQGTQGVQGVLGIQGNQGSQGTIGSQGIQGISGTLGSQGTQGVQGVQGRQGIQGIQGIQGALGPAGPQGIQGFIGPQGVSGTSGASVNTFPTDATNKPNITTRTDSGFYEHDTPTTAEGWPVDSSWYHLLACTHSNDANYFSMQFAGSFFNNNDLYYRATNGNGATGWTRIWNSSNDGAGSGLDADLLDGISSASFLRSDADATGTGSYLFNRNNPAIGNGSYAQGNNNIELRTTNASNPILGFHRAGFTATALYHSGYGINSLRIRNADGNDGPIFSTFNDGSGSGLDADLLDGLNATSANSGSTVVSRDGSGNFSAGTITASLNGNANSVGGFNASVGSIGGNWYSRIPVIGSDGLTEMGRYIDFHSSSFDGNDSTFRFDNTSNGNLDLSGFITVRGIANTRPTNDRVQLIQSTSGSQNATLLDINAVAGASFSYAFIACYASNFSDLKWYVRGDGNTFGDGSFLTPADYAEYFEWEDGNPDNEDRRGYTVTLVGNRIRKSAEGDTILGVVSGNPAVVCDTAWSHWNEKYLKDDFNCLIYDEHNIIEWEEVIIDENGLEKKEVRTYEDWNIPEDVIVPENATIKTRDENGNRFTHPRLNPNYDPTQEYVPRSERKEWCAVGLVGKLRICKGQPVDSRWIKMRDISDKVEEWLVR